MSKSLAQYPWPLNVSIARAIDNFQGGAQPLQDKLHATSVKIDHIDALATIAATSRLRQQQDRGRKARERGEDEMALGGLGNLSQSVLKVPGHLHVGPKPSALIEQALDTVPGLQENVFG